VEADLTLPVPPDFTVLVVRTDFSDDAAFDAVCGLISSGDMEGYTPDLIRFEDRRLDGAEPDVVYRRCVDTGIDYLFIADARTITDPEHPLLVLDVACDEERPGRTFRSVPAKVCNIDANLGISNMDYWEYADEVDPDGVFRGFR
jgi:hypothetical protein